MDNIPEFAGDIARALGREKAEQAAATRYAIAGAELDFAR